jgi:hypothetical protein
MLTIPGYPPVFKLLGYDIESDVIEITLNGDELQDYLNLNDLSDSESDMVRFLLNWYMYYRDKYNYLDSQMEYKLHSILQLN